MQFISKTFQFCTKNAIYCKNFFEDWGYRGIEVLLAIPCLYLYADGAVGFGYLIYSNEECV